MLKIRPKHKFMIKRKLIKWSRNKKVSFLSIGQCFHVRFGSNKFTFKVTGLIGVNAGIEPVSNATGCKSKKMTTNEVIIVTNEEGNIFQYHIRIVKMNKKSKLAIVNATRISELDHLQNLFVTTKKVCPNDSLQLAMESLNTDGDKVVSLYNKRLSTKLHLLPGVGFYVKK